MPKVGRVTGINNAINVNDAQRLFNKLKGRLNELQQKIDVLDGEIERAEEQAIVRQQQERDRFQNPVITRGLGAPTGIGPDDVTVAVTIVDRKYGAETSDLYADCTFSYEEYEETTKYTNQISGITFEGTNNKSRMLYSGSIYGTINGTSTSVAYRGQSLRQNTSSENISEWHPSFGHAGGVDSYYYKALDETKIVDEDTIWRNYNSQYPDSPQPPPSNWKAYPRYGDTYIEALTGIVSLLTTDYYNDGNTTLTANQLELVNQAQNAEWELLDPIRTVTITDLDESVPWEAPDWSGIEKTGDYVSGSGEQDLQHTGGDFPTEIKLKYKAKVGSNVSFATVTTTIPTDNFTNTTDDIQIFVEDEILRTDYIDVGLWPTKGQPKNGDLVVDIDITLEGE